MRITTAAAVATITGFVAAAPPSILQARQSSNASASTGSVGNPGYNARVGPSNANCTRQYYDITVTANSTVFQGVNPQANMVRTDGRTRLSFTDLEHGVQTVVTSLLSKFVAQLPATSGNFTQTYVQAMRNVTGTYRISGTYCTPSSGYSDNGAIQLLVHG